MLLGKIREAGCENIAVHPGDVRDLFDVLPDRKHRQGLFALPRPVAQEKAPPPALFVTPEYFEPFPSRCLKLGAEFRVATDIPDYVRQTLEEVPRAGFEWLGERALR